MCVLCGCSSGVPRDGDAVVKGELMATYCFRVFVSLVGIFVVV